MSDIMAIWDRFCQQHGILEKPVPLFAAEGSTVRVLTWRKQRVLERSPDMEALVIEETTKVVDDFHQGSDVYDGLIYMMYWIEDAHVVPLYIGRTEKYGWKDPNLSANIKHVKDKAIFSRWGYDPRYHIGALSAAAGLGHSTKPGSYTRWAERLFEVVPTEHPELKREAFFWMSAWRKGTVG